MLESYFREAGDIERWKPQLTYSWAGQSYPAASDKLDVYASSRREALRELYQTLLTATTNCSDFEVARGTADRGISGRRTNALTEVLSAPMFESNFRVAGDIKRWKPQLTYSWAGQSYPAVSEKKSPFQHSEYVRDSAGRVAKIVKAGGEGPTITRMDLLDLIAAGMMRTKISRRSQSEQREFLSYMLSVANIESRSNSVMPKDYPVGITNNSGMIGPFQLSPYFGTKEERLDPDFGSQKATEIAARYWDEVRRLWPKDLQKQGFMLYAAHNSPLAYRKGLATRNQGWDKMVEAMGDANEEAYGAARTGTYAAAGRNFERQLSDPLLSLVLKDMYSAKWDEYASSRREALRELYQTLLPATTN
jgi:hypothetical protein